MAALTPAQLELASSLTQDELPTRLRCAICSKLAVNAFRLPCCETAICENCQASLPSSCPVCEHTPVSAADCTVYKSLRTTVRVFIKTEEKKREATRPKANGSAPVTPIQVTPAPTPIQNQEPAEPPAPESIVPEPVESGNPSEDAAVPTIQSTEPSVENEAKTATDEIVNDQLDTAESSGNPAEERNTEVEGSEEPGLQGHGTEESLGEEGEKGDAMAEAGADQSEQSGMNFGFDPMNNNFNMNFGNGDMTQMQMMMAMQNGMNPAAFGSFPIMGMMDPMMMQNMLMNGGFGAQGMGMNGMNMNMGINGFNGGGDDWNGQQSWNVGQDNFNQNAPGMGNGDFGNFNSNFRTGNYGHHNQFNDHRRGNYGFRARGRGRGYYAGYGRGYHHNYNHQGNAWANGQYNNTSQAVDTTPGNVDEFGRTIRADQSQDGQPVGQDGQNAVTTQGGDSGASETQNQVVKERVPGSEETQGDNTSPDGDVSALPPRASDAGPPLQRVVPDVPLNAPTGPKAMRQGLPNTSLYHLKARGYIMDEKLPSISTNGPIVASPVEEKPKSRSSSPPNTDRHHQDHQEEHGVDEKDQTKQSDRGRERSRSHSISKAQSLAQSLAHSRSRSRSRDHKESHRHKRHRSPSISDLSRDSDYRRRKHRSKRGSTRDDDDNKGRSRTEKFEERSRSASPTERDHKRSNHRSHRDRDRDRDRERERERERDRDRDRDRDRARDRDRERDRDRGEKRRDRDKDRGRDSDHERHRKPSHRSSHRDREDDRGRERERGRDRDSTRGKERSRELDKDHRIHDNRPARDEPPTPVESSGEGLEIRGASGRSSDVQRRGSEATRRASQSSVTGGQKSAPNAPAKDPHTLEREARDRERLLKEAQRIAGMAGLAGRSSGKRSRDATDDRGGRRKSRRSEPVNVDDEERMKRIEAEREGHRWD
ncbi:hypothetical protein NPX13_g1858 [Xylaria arbuscula]|uniref:RING-type domain-containing protein n=1 Tax=Xylaria arbuscula TaxID=114810 RepID=A0A9W8NL53_9PEZI|nr:hypothetical protein NPX13_g1858 [Xylaria arbuscula]